MHAPGHRVTLEVVAARADPVDSPVAERHLSGYVEGGAREVRRLPESPAHVVLQRGGAVWRLGDHVANFQRHPQRAAVADAHDLAFDEIDLAEVTLGPHIPAVGGVSLS